MRVLSCIGIFVLMASPGYAATLNVPAGFPTIQEGIDAASDGDTVLVWPGVYDERINFNGKTIALVSWKGPENTIILGGGGTTVLINNGEGEETVMEGFTLRGGQIALNVKSAATIRNNIFTDQTIANWAAILLYDRAKFMNNTICFAANGGIACYSNAALIKNNIIAFNGHYGIYAPRGSTNVYNDVYGNPHNYESSSHAGVGSISEDPRFRDKESRDFRLDYDSPCINAGDPDSLYNDPDHTRNDMGAIPFYMPDYPLVRNLRLDSLPSNVVVSNTPTIHWSFIPLSDFAMQYMFELEIGTDDDWSQAEMLATGQVISTDSSYVYDGNPLVDGETYHLRIRGNDFDSWGAWETLTFRMKKAPGVPIPEWPVAEDAECRLISLVVENSAYEEFFRLTYDFEIYTDPGLTTLFDSDYGVAEGEGFTSSKYFTGLEDGNEYWWRARASDPFESSAWSEAVSFVPRPVNKIMVPADQPDIQTAIDVANQECGEIVVVAPGDYYENINFHGKNILVTSLWGPRSTIIHSPIGGGPMVKFISGEDSRAGIAGFSFAGGTGSKVVELDNGSTPIIEGNIFYDFDGLDAVIRARSDAVIRNNLFYHNLGHACIGVSDSAAPVIINNTFDSNLRGIYNVQGFPTVRNNIFTNSTFFGAYGEFTDWDYNNMCGNNPDYYHGATPGMHDISDDPRYVDTSARNYRLRSSSPCIDAGDPDAAYNDPDSTRNDMGAFYYNTNPHVLSVPAGYPTIQAAIDAAADGDTVLVADGIYSGGGNRNISFASKVLVIKSESGPGNCIIDCEQHGRGFDVGNIVDTTAAIIGFTIRNGVDSYGVGGQFGGGIRISGGMNLNISNCIFENCTAVRGGGIYISHAPGQKVQDCIFKSNTATENGGGVYFADSASGLLVSNCLFQENGALNGGAAMAGDNSYIAFENCTFVANSAENHGAVVYQQTGQSIDFQKCILVDNLGPEIVWSDEPCGLSAACTNIYGNSGGDWSSNDCLSSLGGTDGNLSVDPLFCDAPSGKLSIMNISPCAPSNNACNALIGAMPIGCWPKPTITLFKIDGADTLHVLSHTPAFSWQYESLYADRQDSLQITVDDDNDWETAALWNPGPIASANTTLIYDGDTLADGAVCYARLRIHNSIVWSDWKQISFRLNSRPSVPVLRAPFDSTIIATINPVYWVKNSIDAESDAVFLDFKLSMLGDLADASHIAQQFDSTGWGLTPLPEENAKYSWTARAFDGFEYSDWAEEHVFWLNGVEQIPSLFVLYSPSLAGGQVYDFPVNFRWMTSRDKDPLDSVFYKLVVALDENFQFTAVSDSIYDTSYVDSGLGYNSHYYWRVFAYDTKGHERKCYADYNFYTWVLGDVNKDFRANVGDAIYLLNWTFRGGPPPVPLKIGDLNADCKVNVGDTVYLINHVFKGGLGPKVGCAE